MTDDDAKAKKDDAQARAEARLREEAAAYRRQEEAEQARLKYGCIGCLGLLVLLLVIGFLLS